MLQRRERRRTKVAKVKNEILKELNQKEGNRESRGQKVVSYARFVSLVHLWEVITFLGGYVTRSAGVVKCC